MNINDKLETVIFIIIGLYIVNQNSINENSQKFQIKIITKRSCLNETNYN